MDFLLFLPVLLFSVVAHEVAHGWVAHKQGDDTALMLGRITLNPIPHLDPIGSLLVPAVLWFSGSGFLFGWARPVPVNSRNFRDFRRGDILVSLAGVGANLVLVLVCLVIAAGAFALSAAVGGGVGEVLFDVGRIARFGILINLILAFFNLIPLPPLDGSHVLYHFLPPAAGARYRELGKYGLGILLLLLFFAPGLFSLLLAPVEWGMALADGILGLWR
jgi:Zn-dependent protease